MLKTWTEAQSYCRENFADLATIETVEDWEKVEEILKSSAKFVWVGLYDDSKNWRWSIDNTKLYGDGNTELGEWFHFTVDNYGSSEHCVIQRQGRLSDLSCQASYNSVCYDGECTIFTIFL